MMRFFAAFIVLIGAASLHAQTPMVPDQMEFAGISLTIREDAKKEIQKDVNLLTQHQGYFSVKTDRAKLFFPLIEKIFQEEGVPSDFKFLALQESSLVADAVSSSNAVGFWQFKDFTALEMGLRVDEQVDERMNVIAATKGAARYLVKNNLQFNNWVHTLQSYQMGAGGVKKAVPDLQYGVNAMEVTANTYWYVKRFLAHKIAFENSLLGEPKMKLIPYTTSLQKTLKEIARELSVEEPVLREYNKWLKAEYIPIDKPYTVIVPVGRLNTDFNKLWLAPASNKPKQQQVVIINKKSLDTVFQINGIRAIRSTAGENAVQLAERAKIDLGDFLKFNEIDISSSIQEGMIFLLARKKNYTFSAYHKAKAGETLWSVSQAYGMKIKKIRKYNAQLKSEELLPGEIIWLSSKHPEVQEANGTIASLNQLETFDWIGDSKTEVSTTISEPVQQEIKESNYPTLDSVITVKSDSIDLTEANFHTVSPKETLYSIANQYNVKITDLLKWNSLNINEKLKPGQVLILRPTDAGSKTENAKKTPPDAYHEVKQSDTLYGIARQYGVTIRDIMEWNNKKDFTLSKGERLVIKGK